MTATDRRTLDIDARLVCSESEKSIATEQEIGAKSNRLCAKIE